MKPLKERIREILKECFNCRTSTQEYHLEFDKALQAILTEIKERLPKKKKYLDECGSVLPNINNVFENIKRGEWNAYHDEVERMLE